MTNHYNEVKTFINNNYWTNWLGLARTLLASSLLLTLLCNNKYVLFYTGLNGENFAKFDSPRLNLYSWFDNFEVPVAISIAVLVAVVIGIFPRYTCIPHWFVTYSFFVTSTATDGGEQVGSIMSLLLVPICLLDNRKWHWDDKVRSYNFYAHTVATTAYILLQLQIFVIYFFSSIGKFNVEEWKNGTVMYYWLTHPLFGTSSLFRPLVEVILKSSLLTTMLTWSVLLLELVIAISIFSPDYKFRRFILITGIFFHVSIAVFMGIVSFSINMIACLILYYMAKNKSYELRLPHLRYFNYNFSYILRAPTKKN